MRVLVGSDAIEDVDGVDDNALRALYAAPRLPWLRVNMVASVDGSAAGHDGRSGTINNPADGRVFGVLRELADAVLVGAGTARAEGYGPLGKPLVIVSRRALVPERLRDAEPGRVVLMTAAGAEHLAEASDVLGPEHVLVTGEDGVDLAAGLAALHERGLRHLLGEGGPSLLGDLLAAGLVDELDHTTSPLLVGGDASRIVADVAALADGVALRLATLLEDDGTLLARWLVARPR